MPTSPKDGAAATAQPMPREELEGKLRSMAIGGQQHDITKAFPLKVGDWRKLGREGVTFESLSTGKVSIETLFLLTKTILAKVGINDDSKIDDLTIPEMTMIVQAVHLLDDGTGAGSNPT